MEQFEVVITTEQIKSTSEIFEYQGLIIEDTSTTQEVYIIAVMSWLNILRHDLYTYVLFLAGFHNQGFTLKCNPNNY